MLRDMYVQGSEELKKVFSSFKTAGVQLIDVWLYEMLTPDSFLWKIRTSEGFYYLYGEDYVSNIETVTKIIEEKIGKRGHFIEAQEKATISDINLTKYVVESGHDKVLLYKIDSPSKEEKEWIR